MEKVLIQKRGTFEDGLFTELRNLSLGQTVEVCYSAKAYTQILVSKWNRHTAGPNDPLYQVVTTKELRSGAMESVLTVLRVK